jgi:hypothetical protein
VSNAAEAPGGVPAELRRIQAQVSDLQQQLKDQALAHGTNPAWAPFVSLYATTWVPLLRMWQKFYADYKGWSGHPSEWTEGGIFVRSHQGELDHLMDQMGVVRSKAAGMAPIQTMLQPTSVSQAPAYEPPPPPLQPPQSPLPHDAIPSRPLSAYLPIAIAGVGALVLLALATGRGR